MSLNSSIAAVLASLSLLAIGTSNSLAQDKIETDYPNDTQAVSQAGANTAPAAAGSALLAQLVTGSFDLGAPANIAGVLDYCQSQHLADDNVEKTASALIEAQGGRAELAGEPAFANGQAGVLASAQGRRFTLKEADDATARRLCARVASKAEASFLSGKD